LYVECTAEPRESGTRREFDVDVAYTTELLRVGSLHDHPQPEEQKVPDVDTSTDTRWDAYRISIGSYKTPSSTNRRKGESMRRLKFVGNFLLSELEMLSSMSLECCMQLCLLFTALYVRIYIHFIGQWIYLKSVSVPVYSFQPLPYEVNLKYVPDALPMETELAVVVMGPLATYVVFVAFVLLSVVATRVVGRFPVILSTFVVYCGLSSLLDPVLILIFDLCAGNFSCSNNAACQSSVTDPNCHCRDGDAFKLYRKFQSQDGSGVVGIILVILVYVVFMFVVLVSLYTFVIKLHNNGRLLDLYRRQTARESEVLLPHDAEVSISELQSVVARAQQWTGARGTKRRVRSELSGVWGCVLEPGSPLCVCVCVAPPRLPSVSTA
jgi:hypothetical protein